MACCSPRDHKESDMTKQLNSNKAVRGFIRPPVFGGLEGVPWAGLINCSVGLGGYWSVS